MNKKAFITGISGFVGPYLRDELLSHNYDVSGLDKVNKENTDVFDDIYFGDITDKEFVDSVVKESMPDEIYHLAGFSSVKKSFEQPDLTMSVNVGGTQNLLNAVSEYCSNARILIVSSADVYGIPKIMPITEKEPTKETSPYSVSRIFQEKLVKDFQNLDIVISRSFNHTGPGQLETFVLADFAKQIAEMENGQEEPVIHTGNLAIIRDFSDVRDVVKAYYALLQNGKKGEIYNVGSGVGYNLNDLLIKMIGLSSISISIKQDSGKIRLMEIPVLISDIAKIYRDTGWKPSYAIDKTISDLLNYWRSKVKKT